MSGEDITYEFNFIFISIPLTLNIKKTVWHDRQLVSWQKTSF